ncbi:hypothetical protein EC971742_0623, partial [Escherichia coli 97.1742]
MVSKPFQRPFSLATRLTFFISLATIAAEMLNALDCQRTLPLYLQASLLPKA